MLSEKEQLDWFNISSMNREHVGCLPVQGENTVTLLYTLIRVVKELESDIQEKGAAHIDLGVAMERVAKLESENDALRKRLEQTEKIMVRVIGQLSMHRHLEDGKASIPLECLV